MRYLLTNQQMRDADEAAMKKTPPISLMENAGKGIAERVQKIKPLGEILCVCGGGNNGGDGFVCAWYLLKAGYSVSVFCNAKNKTTETEFNQNRYLSLGGKIIEEFPASNVSIVVDCLLGTGLKGELKGNVKEVIEKINALKKRGAYILSADVPSGLQDNGRGETVVFADETLCIGQEKLAVRLLDGLDCAGAVHVLDIGINPLESEKPKYALALEERDVAALLPKRRRNSHKGTYGRVAVVGGSLQYTGAAYLSTLAALRSGVGYTALFVPNGIAEHYLLKAPETLIERLNGGGSIEFNEADFEKLLSYDSVCFGMGAGISEDVYRGVEYLLANYTGKLVLDADALNSLAKFGSFERFLNKKCSVLITPHVKEFSRLTELSVDEILDDCVGVTKKFALENGVTVLLKGASTLISDGVKTVLADRGCSAQAKGGSGDVLSGVVAGLCATGLDVFEGAAVGCYSIGVAAEIASEKYSEYSALPSDVIQELGVAFKRINSAINY